LMDIALHPRFADNKWVYISYHKARGTAPDVNGKDFPSPATRSCVGLGTAPR
jgi:hypothetical protein